MASSSPGADVERAVAREAGLHYRFDDSPGIRRRRRRGRFAYVDPEGRPITDAKEIRRLDKLAVPPAWTDVWLSPDPAAHLLATGRDARGRKQYRYHPAWRSVRDADKFDRMAAFAVALPRIRAAVARDLARGGLPREKVLAAIVRLLDTSLIRIGNDEYKRANRSFGLTTLHDRHVEISGFSMTFEFRGKSGKLHTVKVADRRLARIIKRCRDLPGYELFQYLDDDGARRRITSNDVNDYLHAIAGAAFSAKDFRTWHGTVLAAQSLAEMVPDTGSKRAVTLAVEQVAARLGNTPAICRKSYIHPGVIDCFVGGKLVAVLSGGSRRSRGRYALTRSEAAVLRLLRGLGRAAKTTRPGDLKAALRRSLVETPAAPPA